MTPVAAIILAAGKGTRMYSSLVKVMHEIGEKPMLYWPIKAARGAGASKIVVVTGHQSETVRDAFADERDITFALQKEQLGTGHATASAKQALQGFSGTVMILCGDVPLLRTETLSDMLAAHETRNATVTVLTTKVTDPFGYGRIVRREGGRVCRIVEEKDATVDEKEICEINSGIYCVAADFLFAALEEIDNNNAQGEYYLTDIIKIAVKKERLCIGFHTDFPDEVMGVNNRLQLSAATKHLRQRINEELMLSGVTMIDPATAYIEDCVIVAPDSIICPNVHISGKSVIGSGCRIEPGAIIRSCKIGDNVIIKAGSVLEDSEVGNDVAIGPMAHLRPGTVLSDHVKIGNFVETKKIVMGKGSKASHLTYLGDAEIGSDVNIGCGTITCNYDGVKKHKTVIGDGVFVGSDVQFVAPVAVGRGSLIAAGTTVTQDVPPDSLAIARTAQVNKDGWVKRKKQV